VFFFLKIRILDRQSNETQTEQQLVLLYDKTHDRLFIY